MQATTKMATNKIGAVIHSCNPQSGQVHVKPFILLIQVHESGHGEGLCAHSSTSSSQCSPVNSGTHSHNTGQNFLLCEHLHMGNYYCS